MGLFLKTMETKSCNKCGNVKCVSEFNKSKLGKYGVKSICRLCERLKYREDYKHNKNNLRERAKEHSKEWRKNNIVKAKTYNKEWKINNHDKVKADHKEWIKNNPNKIKAYNKKWVKNNRGKVTAKINKWKNNNPDKVNLHIALIARNNNISKEILQDNPIFYESLKTLVLIKRELRKCK